MYILEMYLSTLLYLGQKIGACPDVTMALCPGIMDLFLPQAQRPIRQEMSARSYAQL